MVPKKMWNTLLSHHVHVIACGDNEQLPPINKDADNHVLDTPHIFLDEVMRQAQESEIVRLSMFIREGNNIEDYIPNEEEVKIFNTNELSQGMLFWADQILCAKNKTRHAINTAVRQFKGYKDRKPQIGDKIIGLDNHWDYLSNSMEYSLTNGSIGYIKNFSLIKVEVPEKICKHPIDYMITDIRLDNGDSFSNVPINYHDLMYKTPLLNQDQEYLMFKQKDIPPLYNFNYGYAITTWKAQGSEWDNVLTFIESFPEEEELRRRYLYTTITRAKKKLVLIK